MGKYYDHLPAYAYDGHMVEARCRKPHGGLRAIWSIRVDDTWYALGREGDAYDSEAEIKPEVEAWVRNRFQAASPRG
jgi:hypothetical protein